MAEKSNFSEPQIYTIPPNFAREGTFFNGALRLRNAIEALIVCFVLGYLISLIPLPFLYLALVEAIIVIPAGIVTLIGFNDSPLTIFILDAIRHSLSNKNLKYYSFGIKENEEKGENK